MTDPRPTPAHAPADAAAGLQHRPLIIDAHNDSIVARIRRGHVGLAGEVSEERRRRGSAVAYLRQYVQPLGEGIQVDIPRLRRGGVDAAFFAVDATRARSNHLLYVMDALGVFLRDVDEHAGDVTVARSADDIVSAAAAGRLAAVLAIENSNALEQSLDVLPLLHRLGLRSLTLTHSCRAWAADGCEVVGGGGLTGFGRDLLQLMNEVRVLVDVSHLNARGFDEVLERSGVPVLASHSCCRALCDHPRNLTDGQLAALGQQGGVVALTFVPFFVDAEQPSLARLLDHVEHAVERAGLEHVGFGSDFDGGGTVLADAAEYARLTEGLLERGFGPEAVAAVMGGNLLRLLRQTIG